MYFWKVEKLKNDLRKKPLSESESFKYLYATLFLYSLGMIPFLENNIWDVYSAIIIGVISAIGVYYVYKCNKGAKGNNFLQKYLAIGWVVGIRWMFLIMLPTSIIFFILIGIYYGVTEYTTAKEVTFFNLVGATYFWLLGKHIKELA